MENSFMSTGEPVTESSKCSTIQSDQNHQSVVSCQIKSAIMMSGPNDQIFALLQASTPRSGSSNEVIPGTPDLFEDQHSSFNESDTIFADLDIDKIERDHFSQESLGTSPGIKLQTTSTNRINLVKSRVYVESAKVKSPARTSVTGSAKPRQIHKTFLDVVDDISMKENVGKTCSNVVSSQVHISHLSNEIHSVSVSNNKSNHVKSSCSQKLEAMRVADENHKRTSNPQGDHSRISHSHREIPQTFNLHGDHERTSNPLHELNKSGFTNGDHKIGDCSHGVKVSVSIVSEERETSARGNLSIKDSLNPSNVAIEQPTNGSHSKQINEICDKNSVVSRRKSGGVSSDHTPKLGKSIKDRIKSTLQKNAKVPTPKLSRTKADLVAKALKEAEADSTRTGLEFDMGPFYGLPSKVKQLLKATRGIENVYDWQDQCLNLEAVKQRRNLIYSLPTSGGKTLVAEILIMRELLCLQRDAILILPFVSIVQEKVRGLSQFAVDLDFLVEEYAGSKGSFPPRKRRKRKSLYICTIEKASSLVNSLIENKRLDNIGLVVVDELHMLGEGGSRGATLEMTLTKLMHSASSTQIIGMSATLSNIGDLQIFLNAEIYTNNFRPVELKEYVKIDDNLYKIDPNALCPDERLLHDRICTFPYCKEKLKYDPDHIAGLALEVVPQHSCLVFCPTKKNCENVAELICRMMPRPMLDIKKQERRALIKSLLEDGNGQICPVLKRTLPCGVAYHHSGLTMDERKAIEEAYSDGVLCLLCCTSTLAAGVNLPAKRVILRSPYVGQEFLGRSQYKQMVGRAGRAGLDSSGESILVLQKKDRMRLMDLVCAPFDSCHSSLLYSDNKGMRALLLTTIGLQITPTENSLLDFLHRTLWYVQNKDRLLADIATEAITQLTELGLIVRTDHELAVSDLGRAVYKGSIDIDRGPQLYGDLQAAQESLCIANYLHLLYLVTPYDMVDMVKPSWSVYLDELGCLDGAEMKVATLVGVLESYVAKRMAGQRITKAVNTYTYSRFYLTLILYKLWKQKTIWDVSAKFQQPRGFIQQLLSSAATLASCVTNFCQEMPEFWAFQDLLSNFVKKLSYCTTAELIPLMEIPGVKHARAKQLYNAGYKHLQQIAYSEPEAMVKQIEHLSKSAAKQIVASAQMLLSDKAEALREEADDMVALPMDTGMIEEDMILAMATDMEVDM